MLDRRHAGVGRGEADERRAIQRVERAHARSDVEAAPATKTPQVSKSPRARDARAPWRIAAASALAIDALVEGPRPPAWAKFGLVAAAYFLAAPLPRRSPRADL